jgi:putative nucleotidyltransferase with HDIG domain
MTLVRPDVEEQLEAMSQLPVSSQVLIRLNQAATCDRTCAEDLGRIILKDQALTTRVLKVVNAAAYQQPHREPVTTISRAVVIIGFNGIRRLALGMAIYDALRSQGQAHMLQGFWDHALATAITARLLGCRSGYASGEEAFVAGLVHDIGKLVLASCDPELYARILSEANSSAGLRAREKEAFGLSHALAGKKLAKRWILPPVLVEVIGDHHARERVAAGNHLPLLLQIVIGANRFSPLVLEATDGRGALQAARYLQGMFGLNPQEVARLHQDLLREYQELAQFFDAAELPAAIAR